MSHAATYAGRHRLRPPHVQLRFDLTLDNPHDESRWAILRDELPGSPEPVRAVALDAYRLDGGALVLHALAEHGLYAVALPPAGRVMLEALPVSMWSEPPDEVEITIVLASVLTAEGAAPAFDVPLHSEPGARSDAARVGDQSTVAAALAGPLAVDWLVESEHTLAVALGS